MIVNYSARLFNKPYSPLNRPKMEKALSLLHESADYRIKGLYFNEQYFRTM